MLAKTVADFAKKESPVERFRKLRDDEIGYDPAVWQKMGELGWLSVPFPESVGGFGGSFIECALILEELGKTLVPEPYLASVVLGGYALMLAGSEAQQQQYLSPMIAGQTTLALAYAEDNNRYDVADVETTAEQQGAGFVLSGSKTWVLNGHNADYIIVSAKLKDGLGLFVVSKEATGLTVSKVETIDGRKAAIVTLDRVSVNDAARLGGDAADVLERVMQYGAAAAVAESVGVCQAMLEMTVEYLGTREQFDVKIGTFQALQHRAVNMFTEVELLRSISMASMVRVDEDDAAERQRDVSAAKYQLATGGAYVAQQAIQLHGGIGVTDEHDVGLYFKRLYALNALFGDADHHIRKFTSDPAFTEVANL